MRTFIVNGDTYAVEFRHVKPGRGIAHKWKGYIQACTTAVVMQLNSPDPDDARAVAPEMVAIETVMCDWTDKFSRREGRTLAIRKIASRCGKIRPIARDFLAAYYAIDPEPVRSAGHKRPKLAEMLRQNRIKAGAGIREERALARAARS